MNRTNLEHLTIALIIQCAGWLLCGDLISGALLATGIFIGREHAQREYKLGDPSLLVGYEALDLWRWEMDALLDLLLPVVGVWGVVYFSFLALFCRNFAIDSGKRFRSGIYSNQWAINRKPAVTRVLVGSERGNRKRSYGWLCACLDGILNESSHCVQRGNGDK